MSQIFNLSFETGTYPEKLKVSKTIPIYKKGSKLEPSNYRPISLLSNLNKILEKLMYARVYKFLNKFNCIYNLQFGFREKYSTNHALINITESIRLALDNDKTVCGIFVDLQKAFDTVNHEILIEKLNYYGIRGIANSWFKSYLNDRKQFVSDDTNLLHINDSLRKTKKYLNYDLRHLHNWLLANKISLNCSKTELIFFHKPSTQVPLKPKIKINGNYLNHQHAIKYLGIYLDETLSGDHHCKELSKKLSRTNGMLAKIRHYAPNEILPIYHALLSSQLKYGSQIWGQTNNQHVQKIIKLQKKALRIISFSEFRAHTSPIFKQYKILKFQDHIVLENCLLIHDFIKNNLPQSFNNYFKTTENFYNSISTRNSKNGFYFCTLCKVN